MVTIVGELFARREARCLADDFIALDHEARAVGMQHDPFAPQQCDRAVGSIVDRDEVNEGVRLVGRETGPAEVMTQFVEAGGETGQFAGFGHGNTKPEKRFSESCKFRHGRIRGVMVSPAQPGWVAVPPKFRMACDLAARVAQTNHAAR